MHNPPAATPAEVLAAAAAGRLRAGPCFGAVVVVADALAVAFLAERGVGGRR